MSEGQRGRSVALWGSAGDILAEDVVKACPWQGMLDTLNAGDGHIVDHGTAYFSAGRFPRLPDSYRRTRSVIRGPIEFGITNGARRPARILARFSNTPMAGRTPPLGQPVRRMLAGDG